ncbi:MAG: transcriptional regulator, partial [Caulobacter sp.]|nr:transcriptional regulator [Caulobacter sp.]
MSTINSANSAALLGLFAPAGTDTSMASIDLLTLAVSGAVIEPDTTVKNPLPTAPWTRGATAPQASDLVTLALQGRKFIDESAAKLDVKGASDDYKKMFALYQGINTLSGLADRYNTAGVTPAEQ